MSSSLKKEVSDQTVIIRITGRFDFTLRKEFLKAYQTEPAQKYFVIDLANTEMMDSSALGMLLLLREHAGGEKAQVSIQVKNNASVKKLLEVAYFNDIFHIE